MQHATQSLTSKIWMVALVALLAGVGATFGAVEEGTPFFTENPEQLDKAYSSTSLFCQGKVNSVIDAADESVRFTNAIYGTGPGGGEGGQFDRTPVITVKEVVLEEGCINVHFSVISGSAQSYGVAPMGLFQITLTPADGSGPPVALVGHYNTPYGIPSPAVALEAETDVDMLGANFFRAIGDDKEQVRPGVYNIDVWWAGAPPGVPGGSIAAAFVLKAYLLN